MTVENVTVNRSYPLPNAANPLNVDVARFITALTMLDIDVQSVLASVAGYAALDGPAFTGVPTAPTAASGTDTTQIATTAFVQAALDLLEASVAGGMSFKGNWDASSGSFPGGGAAQTGWYYIVSVAGTVDGVAFDVNDAIIAKADDAAVDTYTGNWVKRDATDAVQSVAGLTGAISAAALKTALAMAIADVSGLQAALDGKSNTAHVHTGVYEPVDANIVRANVAKALSKGFKQTAYDAGTKSAGTFTPDYTNSNRQYFSHGAGAFTLTCPADDCDIVMLMTNASASGAITESGFGTRRGDDFDNTGTNKFWIWISVVNGNGALTVLAADGNA